MLNTMKILMKKILIKSWWLCKKHYQSIETFLLKDKRKFCCEKNKNTVPWTYVINDLNDEETFGTFYEKELQKTAKNEFRIEKVIKKKGNKLNVKWKRYGNSFNSWIDKSDLI